MLEVTGGNKDEMANTWGSVHPLRLWTPAGKSWAQTTLIRIVPGLVGEWGCVRGQALIWSDRLEQEEFFKKEKKKRHFVAV